MDPGHTVNGHLADCSTRGLDNSRTSQLADSSSHGRDNSRSRRCRQTGKLRMQSRRWHLPVVQSARYPVRESSSPRVGSLRVGVSASCPVTGHPGQLLWSLVYVSTLCFCPTAYITLCVCMQHIRLCDGGRWYPMDPRHPGQLLWALVYVSCPVFLPHRVHYVVRLYAAYSSV